MTPRTKHRVKSKRNLAKFSNLDIKTMPQEDHPELLFKDHQDPEELLNASKLLLNSDWSRFQLEIC